MSEMPELIRLERHDTNMSLTYSDGGEFTVSYDDLRHACPCAKCAPLRNEDETSKSFRRQVEAMPAEKPKKCAQLGSMLLHLNGIKGVQVASTALKEFGRWPIIKTQMTDALTFMVHGNVVMDIFSIRRRGFDV